MLHVLVSMTQIPEWTSLFTYIGEGFIEKIYIFCYEIVSKLWLDAWHFAKDQHVKIVHDITPSTFLLP